MNDWLRRAGSVLLSGVEALLALAILGAVGMLFDLQAGVQSGAYNREAASGFVIGSFALWLFASVGLVVVGGGHATAWSVLVVRDDGAGALKDGVVRVGLELLVAGALYVGFVGTETPYGPFSLVLGASAVVALGLLVHVAADAALFARRLAPVG